MGFLSKLMKNPLMQMALPFALSAIAGPAGAALTKGGLGAKLFGNMSPLMANALKQSALGFGTSALSGSKRPWKGAMYAGLTSIPFSYMSAANAANAFNQDYSGIEGAREIWKPGSEGYFTGPRGNPMGAKGIDAPNWSKPFARQFKGYEPTGDKVGRVTPWDVLTGKLEDRTMNIPAYVDKDMKRLLNDPSVTGGKRNVGQLMPAEDRVLGADIFTKTTPGAIADGYYVPPETKSDWLPTAVSQAAALYGGRATDEEEWEASRKKRKKELAWMYGVDEDQIEGEMDNPWYGGGGYWNKGGIASLENGGGVNGPGTGTSDSIDAKLSDGEFVMTAKAVENLGRGDRYEGARQLYSMMNMLDPESETMSEVI